MAKSKPSAPTMDRDYMAEDDHRTMLRAAEIHGDKSRMSGVQRHQRKQTKALARMDSLMKTRSLTKGGR
jgi:hypothetical protein